MFIFYLLKLVKYLNNLVDARMVKKKGRKYKNK